MTTTSRQSSISLAVVREWEVVQSEGYSLLPHAMRFLYLSGTAIGADSGFGFMEDINLKLSYV